MPCGFFLSTGCSAFIVKLNLPVAYFWRRNMAAVRMMAMTLMAEAKP